MLQVERHHDPQEPFRLMLDAFARSLWCCMPGIVTDASKLASRGTVTVELAIQAIMFAPDGSRTPDTIRPLVDVPVVFMGGGQYVATFPIAKGDEALIVFADRCIDSWFQSGGVQRPAEPRVHSISDGFAIVGPRSLARLIQNLSTSTMQLRSLDGATYFEIAEGGVANIKATAGLNITGPVNVTGGVAVSGDLSISGKTTGTGDFSTQGKVTASGDGEFNGHSVSNHVHSGVQTGSGDTGTPVG